MPSPVDRARIEELYKPMQALVLETLDRAQDMLDEAEPKRWRAKLADAWRSPERQMEMFRKGRVFVDDVWRPVAGQKTVTNALPSQSAHCVCSMDGSPASMACDLWVVDAKTGELAADREIVWSIIPCAAFQAGPRVLSSGAFFTTIRDWPHIEWRGWTEIVRDGIVVVPSEKRGNG